MASFRAARRALCTAAEAAPGPGPGPGPAPAPAGRWQRLKNSKAGVWCRSLLSDYKEACREIVVGARDRPLKASAYVGLLGGAYACFVTKPDQSSFQAALLDRSNRLALLSPWIRNAGSDLHVQNLVQLRNQGCLRHLSLGLFSLVYSADFDPDSALYEARCDNLSVPWRELPGRVLDVGFVGRWWVLDKKMEDFDVNETEFKHLPAHMQATAPPSVQEVERNERLHRESWLPLPVEEEKKTERTEDAQTKTLDVQEETEETERTEDVQVKTLDVQEETETETDQVVEMVDSDAQFSETLDVNVDPQVTETEDAKVDSPVAETVETTMGTQVLETEDAKVDSPFSETVDGNVDPQVTETEDAKVDSPVVETVDSKVDNEDAEITDLKEQVESVDVKEETVVVDAVDSKVDLPAESVDTKEETLTADVEDSKVDLRDAETANLQLDPEVVEETVEVLLEPEQQHTTEQDQAV